MPAAGMRGNPGVAPDSIGGKPSCDSRTVAPRVPRTAVRLIAAFGCVLGLFGAALAVTLITLDRIASAEVELARVEDAKHACHLATSVIRGQYLEQVRLLLRGATQPSAAYEHAAAETHDAASALTDALGPGPSRELAAAIARLGSELDARFRPLLTSASSVAAEQRLGELEAVVGPILEQTVELHDRLHHTLSRERDEALAREAAMRTWARWVEIVFFLSAIAAAAIVVSFVGRSILVPVAGLQAGASRMAAGDLSARVDVPDRHDEFSVLASTFNRMASDLETHQAALLRSQRLAAIGQIAAGIAHEINNPLGVILGYLKLIRKELAAPGSSRESLAGELAIVEDEAHQCQRIVEDLLDLARPARVATAEIDLADLASEAVDRIAEAGKVDGLIIVQATPSPASGGPAEGGSPFAIRGDSTKLRQVICNLLSNAADATPERGRIEVAIQSTQEHVTLVISDSGAGIPVEHRDHVFEPFFTTKPRGTGLGLAVSQAITDAHGGLLRLEPRPGGGTRALLRLPRAIATDGLPLVSRKIVGSRAS